MSNNNTEQDNFLKAFRAKREQMNAYLNNDENAQKFFDKELERAKETLRYIFMVTSGAFVRPDNQDWAHEMIFTFLEIFMLRHDNFSRSDFAEKLQWFIYAETMANNDKYSKWRKEVLTEAGLDEEGDSPELYKSEEVAQPLDLSGCEIESLSQKLSDILKNPNLPHRIFDALINEIDEKAAIDTTTPEMVKSAILNMNKEEKQ